MRRVAKGMTPSGAKRRRGYGKFINDLVCRIGEYCSYCERPGDLEVEHVVPKSHRPDLENEWTNFLLGCRNCNGIKGNRNRSRNGYLWPDRNDTETAFEYLPDGIVRVHANLAGPDRTKATALFNLVGLGRHPGSVPRARPRDLRWLRRKKAWSVAVRTRKRYENQGTLVEHIVHIVDLACATGYWSVWMTVFAGHPDVRLREAFPGTRFPGTR